MKALSSPRRLLAFHHCVKVINLIQYNDFITHFSESKAILMY